MRRRKRKARISISIGEMFVGHIKNRAKRLGITPASLVSCAVMHVSDQQLLAWGSP